MSVDRLHFTVFESVVYIFHQKQIFFSTREFHVEKRTGYFQRSIRSDPSPFYPPCTHTHPELQGTRSRWYLRPKILLLSLFCLFLSVLDEASWGSCYLTVDKSRLLFPTKTDLYRLEWSMIFATEKKVLDCYFPAGVFILFPTRAHKHVLIKFRAPSCLSKMKDKTLWKHFTCWTFKSKTISSISFHMQRGFAHNILRERVHYMLTVLL